MDYRLKNLILFPMNILYKINPKFELELLFRIKNGYKLNLSDPLTYFEKLQWIKLYYKNDLMPICADKFTVRDYIKSKKCDEILNELLWEGYNPEDIPFNKLPNKFVIKVTHGSGFNIICEDKSLLNLDKIKLQLNKWLKAKYIMSYGESFYGKVKPRIIIEKYLDDGTGEVPKDYKIFCFHGVPKYIMVDNGRYGVHTRNIYDVDWNFMPNYIINYPNDKEIDEKPLMLDELLKVARKLSEDFLHVRADFYIVKDKIYFGELTFTHGAGFGKISPLDFNIELGSYINLPELKE